jgi:hypothetical protein
MMSANTNTQSVTAPYPNARVQYRYPMRHLVTRHPRLSATMLGLMVFALLIAATLLTSQGKAPTLTLTVETQSLPALVPHLHGPSDTVSDVHHGVVVTSLPVVVPEDIWVTEIVVKTENAPWNIIHHMDVNRLDKDGSINRLRHHIFTYGQDTPGNIHFPAPAGIFLAKGQKIGIEATLHNPIPPLGEGGIYKDVIVTVEFRGVPDGQDRYVPINFHFPRVTDSIDPNDDDSMFTVPAHADHQVFYSKDNPPSSDGEKHIFDADGWIIHMGAHMHAWQGGERVDAYINGKEIKTYYSKLTDPEIPWSWQTGGRMVLIRVKKDDVLTLSTTYSNPGNEDVQGAMAMMGIFYTRDAFSLSTPLYEWRWGFEHFLYRALEYIGITMR